MKLSKLIIIAFSIMIFSVSCKKDSGPFDTYFEATMNGSKIEFNRTDGGFINNELAIIGIVDDTEFLSLMTNKNISPGEYTFGMSNQFTDGLYTNPTTLGFILFEGNLNVELHIPDERRIKGTFNAKLADLFVNDTITFTNGRFAVKY